MHKNSICAVVDPGVMSGFVVIENIQSNGTSTEMTISVDTWGTGLEMKNNGVDVGVIEIKLRGILEIKSFLSLIRQADVKFTNERGAD